MQNSTENVGPIKDTVDGMFRAVCEVDPSIATDTSLESLVELINRRRAKNGRASGLMYASNLSKILRKPNPRFRDMYEILNALNIYEAGIDTKHFPSTEEAAYLSTKEHLLAARDDKWLSLNKPGLLKLSISPSKILVSGNLRRQSNRKVSRSQVPEYFGPFDASVTATVTLPDAGWHAMLFRDHNLRLAGLSEKLGFSGGAMSGAAVTKGVSLREIAGGATDFRVIALAQRRAFHEAFPRTDQTHETISRPKWSQLLRAGEVWVDAARIVIVTN